MEHADRAVARKATRASLSALAGIYNLQVIPYFSHTEAVSRIL